MNTLAHFATLKRYCMVNSVTCKIILRNDQKNKQGMSSVAVQCFVNRQRVVIPISIKIDPRHFDTSKELVKASHPDSVSINKIISDARARVVFIQSEANVTNLQLNKDNFRSRFVLTQSDLDFVGFYQKELQARVGELAGSSIRQHKKTLMKLMRFRSRVPFSMLTAAFLQDFERWLKGHCHNNLNTVYSDIKNIRTYTYIAIRKGIEIRNPFITYRLTRGGSRLLFCTMEETKQLLDLYDERKLLPHLCNTLLAFLVSCFTGLRISDLKNITPANLIGDELVYLPVKTRRFKRYVTVPLSDVARRLLRDFFLMKRESGLKSDQRLNDDLKVIAAYAGMRKSLTMHVGRHTFATAFLEAGGSIEVLKELLGHAKITDTMIYWHITDGRKRDQIDNFNKHFK